VQQAGLFEKAQRLRDRKRVRAEFALRDGRGLASPQVPAEV
jgi:hypothetical protein